MKIRVDDITGESRTLAFDEDVAPVNEILVAREPEDFRYDRPVAVRLTHYRAGEDLLFDVHLTGDLTGRCSRCLESFPQRLDREVRLVRKPESERPTAVAAGDEDPMLGYYAGDEIDLAPALRQELIVSLPTRALCAEECRGLCPRCGANRNQTDCDCREETADPRWGALRDLKLAKH